MDLSLWQVHLSVSSWIQMKPLDSISNLTDIKKKISSSSREEKNMHKNNWEELRILIRKALTASMTSRTRAISWS